MESSMYPGTITMTHATFKKYCNRLDGKNCKCNSKAIRKEKECTQK